MRASRRAGARHRRVVLQSLPSRGRMTEREFKSLGIAVLTASDSRDEASDKSGQTIAIDADYVDEHLADLAGNEDLSRYIL